jgi:metal transporter CNNM
MIYQSTSAIKPVVLAATLLLLLNAQNVQAQSNTTGCPTLEEEESSFSLPFPLDLILIVVLVCFSALFSGLTLGLLGLDKIGLEIIIAGDDPELAACAKVIAPVRANGNLLLCTLLLGNVAVNALLSILMANMTSGLVGFLVSTFMIVIFGEIIPQATCSRYALQIGSRSLPIVKAFIFTLYIICKPLSMVLDKALGEEIGTIHSRTELRKMLEIHVQHQAVDEESGKVMDGYVL